MLKNGAGQCVLKSGHESSHMSLRRWDELFGESCSEQCSCRGTAPAPAPAPAPRFELVEDQSENRVATKDFQEFVNRLESRDGSKPTNPKDAIGSTKLPLHLWPTTATALGSLAFLEGALKYGRGNFRAIGVRASIYVAAAMRHLSAWFEGEDVAPDSEIDHLGHALACIAIIADARYAGKLNDDRQYPGGYHKAVEELTPHVKRLLEKYKDLAPEHYTIQTTPDVR